MLFVSLVVSFIEDFKEDFNGKEEILSIFCLFVSLIFDFNKLTLLKEGTQKAYKRKDNNSYLFEALSLILISLPY